MGAKVRKFGKVSIAGDYSVLSTISDFNGYKSVGATPTLLPFYNATQLDEIRRTGLCGFYKDYALVEIPNPYNVTKPNAALTAFDTYFATDKLWFIPQGVTSPVNVFARGGITTLSGNDIETGTVKTRFDMEIGADVAKGFEYKIGLMAAEA
jgi:hypothetical protein